VVAVLPAIASACQFDSRITVQVQRSSNRAEVTESFVEHQASFRMRGTTTSEGQVMTIDCSISIYYDVHEATGSAVLSQRYPVRLRTGRLPKGTVYDLNCKDPLIVELPAAVSGVRATATSVHALATVTLPVQQNLSAIPLAFGKHLRAEPGTTFEVVGWIRTLPPGNYKVDLTFESPARPIKEKAFYAASISCGGSSYLEPILPIVTSMAQVPATTIQPSVGRTKVTLPRISQPKATRTLSCG
jgi:hypothetical protein